MESVGTAPYAGQVIVVTGASRGLGLLLVQHFLSGGGRVVGVSRGDSQVDEPNYDHHRIDVTNDEAVRGLFTSIARSHGRVDVVINNAAVLTSVYAMLMPAARAEEMVRTNLLGTFYVAREAAKIMKKRSYGRIIAIGSMASALEPVGDSIYAATKAASVTLTGVLAKEFASYGITVNTVAVTAIQTDMLDQLPKVRVESVVANLPLPRVATPDDVVNVIDFFASSRSSYITGQTVYLGGVHA